jgi:hypothetical protein
MRDIVTATFIAAGGPVAVAVTALILNFRLFGRSTPWGDESKLSSLI